MLQWCRLSHGIGERELKRSNRLILLIGFFLAIVAFVGVVLLMGQTKAPEVPTTTTVVTAAANIPLGTKITADMVTTKTVDLPQPAGTIKDPGDVIGQIVRTDVTQGQNITSQVFSASASLTDISRLLDPGLGGIAVEVDQKSGVGGLIKAGDRVDVVLALTEADNKNPIVVEKAPTREGQPPVTVRNFELIDPLLNNTTVKVLVENVEVIGILTPPPAAAPATAQGGTEGTTTGQSQAPSLNDQSFIAILAVTPQQAELVRFTQIDGNIALVLRSPKDAGAPEVKTTGITLRQLVDAYGVLPPKIILTEQP